MFRKLLVFSFLSSYLILCTHQIIFSSSYVFLVCISFRLFFYPPCLFLCLFCFNSTQSFPGCFLPLCFTFLPFYLILFSLNLFLLFVPYLFASFLSVHPSFFPSFLFFCMPCNPFFNFPLLFLLSFLF